MDFYHSKTSLLFLLVTIVSRILIISLSTYLNKPSCQYRQGRKRGCRGGKRKQKVMNIIVGHRPSTKHSPRPPPSLSMLQKQPLSEKKLVSSEHTKKKLKIALMNARSVCNKTTVIQEHMIENMIDIMFITETWLQDDSDVIINELVPTGYSYVKRDRLNGRGGGIIVIYNSTLNLTPLQNEITETFEFLECELKYENMHFKFLIVYRPPSGKNNPSSSEFLKEFEDFISAKSLNSRNLFILGDFNIHVDDNNNTVATSFIEMIEALNLTQRVRQPTHDKGHTLDLVINRTTDESIENISVIPNHLSDHDTIIFDLSPTKPTYQKMIINYRKSKTICHDDFGKDLYKSGLDELITTAETLTEKLHIFESTVLELLDKHAPIRTRTITLRPNTKWFTDEIRESKKKRRRAERLWRRTKCSIHKEVYEQTKNETNNLIKETKRSYIRNNITARKDNPKELFKTVNGLLKDVGSKKYLPSHTDKRELSNRFDKYFTDKITKLRSELDQRQTTNTPTTLVLTDDKTESNPLSSLEPATKEEVMKIVQKSPNKSCQLDTIPTWLIKTHITELAYSLTSIVNCSIENSSFPPKLKEAHVTPLIKKPTLDKENLKNYRPISNLSFISKIIERIVARRLQDHVERNNLSVPFQSAYKAGHSTETALLRVHNDIVDNLEGKSNVILLLLDLSAAFDTVDHDILLARLKNKFAVEGSALDWFTKYLSGRQQKVLIDDKSSPPSLLKFGVPQGSVLGPILFTIYTSPLNDILSVSGLQYHLYADDTQIYVPIKQESKKSAISTIESCACRIKTWMDHNKLKLNGDKSELIVFRKKNTETFVDSVNILDSSIKKSPSVRNLGFYLDENLTMKNHITKISQSINFHLRNIRRIRDLLDTNSTKTIIHSLVTSRLDYCNSLLYGLPAKTLKPLRIAQNNAARVISKAKKYDRITPILVSLHWLPVDQRIVFKLACIVFKCLHDQGPNYLKSLLRVYEPCRALRSSGSTQLLSRLSRSKFSDTAFLHAAPKVWNSLSIKTRNSESFQSFKSNLKTELFSRAFNLCSMS